jgi:hypothetical protein
MEYIHFFPKVFPLRDLHLRALNKLRQVSAVQKMLTPFGKDLHPKRWIFIIGCYNSGTTLLERLLASHSNIGSLGFLGQYAEGVDLADALPRPEDFQWPRMWCRCLDQIRIKTDSGGVERANRIKRQWSIWYPKGVDNLLEKSIANATRMPFLQNHFQPAYFIYVLRNGYAVAEGIRRKTNPRRWENPVYQNSYPIEICSEQWKVSDELVQKDRAQIERFIQIKYEELTAHPQYVLDQVTDFLGLDPLPEKVFSESWNVHKVTSPITNMNEQSFKRLSEHEVEIIRNVAGSRLAFNGYHAPKL